MMRAIFTALALLAGITGAHAQLATLAGAGTVGNLVTIGPAGNQIQDAGAAALARFATAPYGIMAGLGSVSTMAFGSSANNGTGMFFPVANQAQLCGNGNCGVNVNGSGLTSVLLGERISGAIPAASAGSGALGGSTTLGGVYSGDGSSADVTIQDRSANVGIQVVNTGTVFMPNLTTSAGAQTSYLCVTTNQLISVAVANTCATSSVRYKENITPLSDLGLDTVLHLEPISYYYKLTGDDKFDHAPGQRSLQLGFTAEQAASIDPRLITYNVDGDPHAFRYEQYVAVLTRAIQEQQEQIDELRREISRRH